MAHKKMPAKNITITRRLEWDAMHRIPGHEGPCKAYHGHRYAAEFSVSAPEFDSLGRVVDFSVIKTKLGSWIDVHFDHTAIFYRGDTDPGVAAIAEANAAFGRPVYFMDAIPTVENITLELAKIASDIVAAEGLRLVGLRVWETPNCSAEWSPEPS
jgi:6-pyruvoyltetrahydropterin/6-carboxytetrahydropterin synthase